MHEFNSVSGRGQQASWSTWPIHTIRMCTCVHGCRCHGLSIEVEQYFKPVSRTPGLPSPHGELAKFVPPVSIKQANKQVEAAISKTTLKGKRQEYQKVSSESKAKIAKYAVENGVKAAVVRTCEVQASSSRCS